MREWAAADTGDKLCMVSLLIKSQILFSDMQLLVLATDAILGMGEEVGQC